MASSGNNGVSWWNNIFQTAKEKSINAFELIRNDLTEFSTTMKNDITEVSSQLKDTNIIDRVITLNSITKESHNINNNVKTHIKSDIGIKNTVSSTTTTIFDRLKNDLLLLQNNQETYLNDPIQNIQDYSEWKESYDPDSNKGLISVLLIENSILRSLYSQLVPAVVSNKDFWSRYFFKAKQIEDEHKKRTNLIEKATSQVNENSYEKLSWDEDGDEEWNKIDNMKKQDKTSNIITVDDAKNIIEDNILKSDIKSKNENTKSDCDDSIKSDEWEKDFEDSNSEKISQLLNVAETVKEKYSNKKIEMEMLNEENKEKNEEWESWD